MKIKVKVKPNSQKESVEQLEGGGYLVCVKAQAIDGKANFAVRKLLAKEFECLAKDVLIKTSSNRKKIVEINC